MKKLFTLLFAVLAFTLQASFHHSSHHSYHHSSHSHHSSHHTSRSTSHVSSYHSKPKIYSHTTQHHNSNKIQPHITPHGINSRTCIKNKTGSYVHSYPRLNANHVVMYYLLFHNSNTGKYDTIKAKDTAALKRLTTKPAKKEVKAEESKYDSNFFMKFGLIFTSGLVIFFLIRSILRRRG